MDKNKRKRNICNLLIALLLGVVCFCAYQIISQQLMYKEVQEANEELQQQYVQSSVPANAQDGASVPALTVPDEEPVELPSAPGGEAGKTSSGERRKKKPKLERMEDPLSQLAEPSPYTTVLDIDFDALLSLNSDMVGWLYGMDGIVSYPVVQGEDNDWYLSHLLDGRYLFAGTLMVDCHNDFFNDDATLIYGHKMKDGTMFGQFGKYDSYEYYKTHPTFTFMTPDITYELQIITCVYTTKWEPLIYNFDDEEHFYRVIDDYRRRGTFKTAIEVEYGDQLVELWSCAYYRENGRMFLLCKVVPIAFHDRERAQDNP